MAISFHRPSKIIINQTAIKHNVAGAKQLIGQRELFAVVKANGYGHGALQTAKAALAGGATGFCVATIDEGIELREGGFTQPIIILGVVETEYLKLVSDYDLAIPAASMEWLQAAAEKLAQVQLPHPLRLHLKVDTGMGRLGFLTPEEVKSASEFLMTQSQMAWEGIFTHFATADQADESYWQTQNERFKATLAVLPKMPKYVHVSNSATALWHEEPVGNMVRYGIGIYGLNPSGRALPETYPLEPALEFVSALIQVKEEPAGAGIGYGETYVTADSEWIGTVPVGYADGWLRKMQGFSVLVEGEFCEIVGRVCMDQFMIRLPRRFPEGTKVTLVGKNQGQEISLQAVADQLDTIHYEVACTFSHRVPREYIEES